MSKKYNIEELTFLGSAKVKASERSNCMDIELVKGKSYLFEISEINNWRDGVVEEPNKKKKLGDPTDPFTGWRVTWSKFYLILGLPFNYVIRAGFMELVGEVDGEHFRIGHDAKGVDTDGKDRRGEPVEAPATGNLIVRANDPKWGQIFYSNNRGTLTLTVYEVID